ncbi:hypothetical protein ACKWTF_011411 [Chironomus riparius]
MIKSFNLIILIFLLVSYSNSCSDKTNYIHILISNLEDAGTVMEMKLRIQFYGFISDRMKSVGTLLSGLKTLQNLLPTDLCKYQSVEVGINVVHAMNTFIDTVRKNLLYAVKSALDDVRDDQSNSMFNFIIYFNDLVDMIGIQSKSLFNDGRGCVMDMEGEIKKYMDVSSKKVVECFQNVSISRPIIPTNFKTHQDDLNTAMRMINYKLREPFYYIWMYSTKLQNDTAAERFNKYCQSMFPTILDIGKKISKAGLEIINALEANNNSFKSCLNRLNATFITVKQHEILNQVNDVCSMANV